MNFSNKNHMVFCPKCNGSKIQKRTIELIDPCKKCGGEGEVDWVSATLKSNQPISSKKGSTSEIDCLMYNIQCLKQIIIEEGIKMGVKIDINIELNYDDRMKFVYPNNFSIFRRDNV